MISSGEYKEAASRADQLATSMPSMDLKAADQISVLRLAGKAQYFVGNYQGSLDRNVQALQLARKTLRPELIATVQSDVAVALRNLGRYREAESTYKAAYDAFQLSTDRDNGAYSDVLVNYGVLLYQLGELDKAADFTAQAVTIRRKLVPPAPASLAQALDNFGTILMQQGRLTVAEPPMQEALDIRRRTLAHRHPDIAASLNNLGTLSHQRGAYAQADELFREAIVIDIATYGEGDPQVLLDLNNLAETLHSMGRPDEALELQLKVLAGRERRSKIAGPGDNASFDLALSNANVANLLSELHRDHEAEKYYLKALTLDEKRAGGKPSTEIAADLNNLGELMRQNGKPDEADAFFAKGIQIAGKLGVSGLSVKALLLNNLGVLDLDQGHFQRAQTSFEASLEIRNRILPADHRDLAVTHAWLAETLSSLEEPQFLFHARKALSIVLVRGHRQIDIATSSAKIAAEARTSRSVVENVISAIARSDLRNGDYLAPSVVNDVLAALQISQSSGTAVVAARTASALLSSDQNAASLIRYLSDLTDRRDFAAQAEASQAAGPADTKSNSDVSSRQIQLEIEERLRSLPPEFAERVRPPSLISSAIYESLDHAQGWLGFVVGSRNTTVVLVTRSGIRLHLFAQGYNRIGARVRALVEQLDPHLNRSFDLNASYGLYQDLLGPFAKDLGSLTSLVICSDGPLESLPLSVLVTSQPQTSIPNAADGYRRAHWLSDRSILQLTPSFAVKITSDRARAASGADKSFIGFGNPALGATQDVGVEAGANELLSLISLQGTDGAVTKVSELPSLPETAIQLDAMNSLFGVNDGKLIMGSAATRAEVLSEDLSGFRFVAFATHGLLASANAAGEPALVMTPVPGQDDGLLTATDIAGLTLNADLVILSACNTAAPRLGYAADGLSGLSRAFFQAGARSVLISHWPVDKNATTDLMKILATFKDESIAVAFNRAARALRNEEAFSHPTFWAAFSLVGGGREVLLHH